MQTAKAWGLTPSQWDACSGEDKAEMMAAEEAQMLMGAVEAQDQQERAEAETKKRRPTGRRR